MKRAYLALVLVIVIIGYIMTQNYLAISAVTPTNNQSHTFKVGLLVEGKIVDETWESLAYKGLRKIRNTYNAKIDVKEQMNTDATRRNGLKDFAEHGYNLIIGNGTVFQKTINEVAPKYPNVKFVFFCGDPKGKNVSSFYFNAKSLGYFSGMIAGLTTKNHKIGLVPAFDYMDEVPYFIKGAKDQDPRNEVLMETVQSWDNKVKAGRITDHLLKEGVDVIEPMGDGYNIDVTMRAWKAHVPVIGYVNDESSLVKDTILTTGIQDLSNVYVDIADKYVHNKLESGKYTLDFSNGAQRFTPFNPKVDKTIQSKVNNRIKQYINGNFVLP